MKRRKVQMPTLPTALLESESWPRYQRQGEVDARDPLPEIQRELQGGGKVLWVCNVVDRAMDAWDRARANGEIAKHAEPLIYHSRFRYEDRVSQHNAVIQAFKEPGPALAICTQVAEMSLDLSAALLVAELAPVPALIQWLGRLNRRAMKGDPARAFIVTEVGDNHLPYAPAELDAARDWLTALGDRVLAQSDLTRQWEAVDGTIPARRREVKWLDGGPATEVAELREGSLGITVLLAQDAELVRRRLLHPVRAALPMPAPPGRWKNDWRMWPEIRGLPVAPAEAIDYSRVRGAKWKNA
jgi:CRISPR-associated endonuclease/helicase Cas3